MIATRTISSMARKVFAIGIVAYVIAGVGFYVFVARVFGAPAAIIFSLILSCPLLVAVRMRHRWTTVSGRELLFLCVLCAFVFGGITFTVWKLYDSGCDQQHAEDLRFYELARLVHADKAFHNVEFSTTRYKGRYAIDGSVPTRIDYERLQALCEQYGFAFYTKKVIVMNEGATAEP